MEKIVIHIYPAGEQRIDLVEFPHLSSSKRLIQKGIGVLHKHLPRIVHFLSRQRAFSHLQNYPLEVQVPEGMDDAQVCRTLKRWIGQKRIRRIVYVVLEVAVLPLALVAGFLPGPNIFFYSIFILLYFHLKAFVALGRIRIENLPLQIVHEQKKAMPG